MDAETSLKIFGTQDLSDLFDEMSKEVKKNVVIIGFRKAGKIILDEAKNNLEGEKGASKYQKKLGTKIVPGELALHVGMLKGGIGWTAHFLDSGTVPRFYKTSSKSGLFCKSVKGMHSTGAEKGTGFFENAIESTETQVNESIYDYVKQAFERLINRYEGKPKK